MEKIIAIIQVNENEIPINEWMPNEILAVFLNGSNYDYHFIMKELSSEFERKF